MCTNRRVQATVAGDLLAVGDGERDGDEEVDDIEALELPLAKQLVV